MIVASHKTWDIFCKIVDNFGDIGVCWRLSQQLAHEHQLQIRLFIDDLSQAKKIIPDLDVSKTIQVIRGIEIHDWPNKNIVEVEPASVVLETFSCELPGSYLQKMVSNASIWINLEYLSAESWVSDFHAKPSPHPKLAITKHYFFPGFQENTGGLIRESNLIAKRDAFLNDIHQQEAFWQKIGISNPNQNQCINISLFCYPQANVSQLLTALNNIKQKIRLLIPDNKAINETIDQFSKLNKINSHLTIHHLPFLSQTDYDRLLQLCDLNFVRGEDSWIRAIWAAKLFIWQPYIQAEDTHLIKLKAFLDVYLNDAQADARLKISEAHLAWSNGNTSNSTPFQVLIEHLPNIKQYAKEQSKSFAKQADLATKLVFFSKNLAKK